MKNKTDANLEKTPSIMPQKPEPETAIETVNNYGTYNIQPTSDTQNDYPAISQGYSKYIKRKYDGENKKPFNREF